MKQALKRPVYRKIKEFILEKIEKGEWRPGMKIPSEAELTDQFETSRMTVNRAMRELAANGRIVRRQGRGTFVAHRKPQSAILTISSIADEIRRSGGEYSCFVHLLCEENASPAIAAEMGLQAYAPVYHSVLVHKKDGIPIQLADRHVRPEIIPAYLKQDFTTITPSEYLLQVAPEYTAEHIVEAVIPDAWIRDLLEINTAEPCLLLKRKTWVEGRMATTGRFFYPGSRYSLGGRFSALQNG